MVELWRNTEVSRELKEIGPSFLLFLDLKGSEGNFLKNLV